MEIIKNSSELQKVVVCFGWANGRMEHVSSALPHTCLAESVLCWRS